PDAVGAVVGNVDPGPAKDAGIRPGDVILEFNGKAVKGNSDLVAMVTGTLPGTTVPVKIMRNKKPMTVNVTVAPLDVEQELQRTSAVPQRQNRFETPEPKDAGLGISVEPLTSDVSRQAHLPSGKTGVVVSDVDSNGEAAGLIGPGDIILEVN